MVILEKRWQSLEEIRKILETDRKQTICDKLEKYDYDFEYTSGRNNKGVLIKVLPEEKTPEIYLKSLLIRRFKLDVQTDIRAFAAFFFMLMDNEAFLVMPWGTRAEMIYQEFGIEISDRTLRTYMSKLLDQGIIHKDDESYQYWCTFYDGLEKVQQSVFEDIEDERLAMEDWFNKRKEYLEAADLEYSKSLNAIGLKNPERWKIALNRLWKETQCVYYKVKGWTFNAIEDNIIKEIYELSTLILGGEDATTNS